MAQIDLRHADILFADGTALVGAINQPGGYPPGTTTMAIDGVSVAIPNGTTFQIAGTGSFTVSATAGGSTPTSVTFSPPLSDSVGNDTELLFVIEEGAVNDGAGVSMGQSTVTIDGVTHAIPNGTQVSFGGHATVYTISSSVGGATPTSITFSPLLTASVADDEALTFYYEGAVNKAGTAFPANGDTTVAIDGMIGAITNGSRLVLSGSTQTFTVVSSVGGATPTLITFSPPLNSAYGLPVDNASVTVGPKIVSARIGEGNLTFEEKRNINYVREKKSIANGFVMTGDDEPMDVSIELVWEFLSSDLSDIPTPNEILNHEGPAEDWLSAGADPCEPFAVNIEINYYPPCSGVRGERITLEEFRVESNAHDLKAGTLSAKGKCKKLHALSERID